MILNLNSHEQQERLRAADKTDSEVSPEHKSRPGGVPPLTFHSRAVYSDAPWKLLLRAVAPCGSHATLGAIVCRQVLSWALMPGCAQHDHNKPPLQSNFDDGGVDCSSSAKLLINCGNSQRDISVCSWAGAQGSKYLSKIRPIDCLGTELPQIYGLMGVRV